MGLQDSRHRKHAIISINSLVPPRPIRTIGLANSRPLEMQTFVLRVRLENSYTMANFSTRTTGRAQDPLILTEEAAIWF